MKGHQVKESFSSYVHGLVLTVHTLPSKTGPWQRFQDLAMTWQAGQNPKHCLPFQIILCNENAER